MQGHWRRARRRELHGYVDVTPSLVAFGELLLRLDVPQGDRLVQSDAFEVRFTGGEANVAASLSRFGLESVVVSAVPVDALGDACIAFIRRSGVETRSVVRRPGRLGLFYVEEGGAGRPARVIYDRAGSAFAECEPTAYDWPAILRGHSWLHVSGTAPAVGPKAGQAVHDAIDVATELGVHISLDLNYRPLLWDVTDAGRALRPLAKRVNVLLGSGEDAARVLGVPGPASDVRDWSPQDHLAVASRLREAFELDVVAGTTRSPGSHDTQLLSGLLVDATGPYLSRGHPIVDATGRIGTGDAFSAGILRGLLLGHQPAATVEFAAAAAHLKQSIRGDVNLVTVEEVEHVIRGEASNRVRR
jgi:2-dehydro-3-deoxygluconokinase